MPVKTVMIGDRRFKLPFIDRIPFPEEQLAELEQSVVADGGATVPVVCWKQKKKPGEDVVIDGAHRLIICAKHHLPCPKVIYVSCDSEEEAADLGDKLNDDRRQSPEQARERRRRARMDRVIERRRKGESLRAIAEAEEVSEKQVRRDLESSTASGGDAVEPPDGQVIGQDGKKRPSRRRTPQAGDADELPILCQRCRRVGPVKDCPKCKEEATRQANRKGKRQGAQKNGQMVYDWRPFHDGFGLLVRQIDKLGTMYGAKESPEAESLRKQIAAYKTDFTAWQRSLIAAKAKG